jgi:hypothetical protein
MRVFYFSSLLEFFPLAALCYSWESSLSEGSTNVDTIEGRFDCSEVDTTSCRVQTGKCCYIHLSSVPTVFFEKHFAHTVYYVVYINTHSMQLTSHRSCFIFGMSRFRFSVRMLAIIGFLPYQPEFVYYHHLVIRRYANREPGKVSLNKVIN